MSTPVYMRAAQLFDAPKIAALHISAFTSNKLMRAIYPTPQIWDAFQSSVEKKITADIRDLHTTVLVAIAKGTAPEPVTEEQTEKAVSYTHL